MDDNRPTLPTLERLRSWYERRAFPPDLRPAQAVSCRTFCSGESFVSGINLPWLAYGCDFGASAWRPDGGVSEPSTRQALRGHLTRLADTGTRLVRWFVLCDGRSGIRVNDEGLPVGLDDAVLSDLDVAAHELSRLRMQSVFVLLDFLLCSRPRIERGVQLGGRRPWLAGQTGRASLVQRVLRPIVEHLGPDAPVAAWDLLNEPEWVTRGFGGRARMGAVSRRAMRRFLEDAVAITRGCSPHPVTVGLASARGLELVRDLGLDIYQTHWYDRLDGRSPLDLPVQEWRLDRPLLLGEYPTRGSARTPDRIVATARRCGYAGALAWSALARDDASRRETSGGPSA